MTAADNGPPGGEHPPPGGPAGAGPGDRRIDLHVSVPKKDDQWLPRDALTAMQELGRTVSGFCVSVTQLMDLLDDLSGKRQVNLWPAYSMLFDVGSSALLRALTSALQGVGIVKFQLERPESVFHGENRYLIFDYCDVTDEILTELRDELIKVLDRVQQGRAEIEEVRKKFNERIEGDLGLSER